MAFFAVFERIINKTYKTFHLVRFNIVAMLQHFVTQGGTGGVSYGNEYNKVEIELRVVQFWTEIKLVITNRTPASRSCNFVITRLISVQIALHSVQLPLFISRKRSIYS